MALIVRSNRPKEVFVMLHTKQASKRKRRSKAVPVLGAAGLLSLAGGASTQAAGPAADIPARHVEPSHQLTLSEEEVSDVSLATFYVFDKENAAAASPGVQLVRGGCGGCGGCRGCGGGGCRCGGCRCGGCGGFRACVGCGGCGGCGVWWWGGGCCLSWGACRLC
jgi:hypothetical protein